MGYHGDGGPAAQAAFHHPEHLAFDSRGDLYVCDNSNDRIRRIDMRTGIVSTVLGNGQRASNGDGGPAVEASTLMPDAICLDVHDNLYVGEKYGFRIRTVAAATGIVSTLVGTGVPAWGEEGLHGSRTGCNSVEAGIWADPDGTVLWGTAPAGCAGTTGRPGSSPPSWAAPASATAPRPPAPSCAARPASTWRPTDRSTLPIAGTSACAASTPPAPRSPPWPATAPAPTAATAARRPTRTWGTRPTWRSTGTAGSPSPTTATSTSAWSTPDGTIRAVCGIGQPWDKGDGGPAISAGVVMVTSVRYGPDDALYLGDAAGRIRRIDPRSGIISTVAGIGLPGYAGDGGAAKAARVGTPEALAFGPDGSLYFADSAQHVIRRVAPNGIIDTVIGDGTAGRGEDGSDPRRARIDTPRGVDVGPDGALFFTDSGNHLIRCLTPGGALRTLAGCGAAGETGSGPAGQRPLQPARRHQALRRRPPDLRRPPQQPAQGTPLAVSAA